MPLFEFMCKKCNEEFEMLVFGSESTKCPKCGNSGVIKQFSSFASTTSSTSHNSAELCQSACDRVYKCPNGCCH
jgi:putative FmdB family regulatory protein